MTSKHCLRNQGCFEVKQLRHATCNIHMFYYILVQGTGLVCLPTTFLQLLLGLLVSNVASGNCTIAFWGGVRKAWSALYIWLRHRQLPIGAWHLESASSVAPGVRVLVVLVLRVAVVGFRRFLQARTFLDAKFVIGK